MAVFDVNLAIFDVNLAILALKTSIFGLKMADLFFFSLQKDYSINVDEVGTNHPIFSFFSAVPVFVIVCSTMVLPASCLMGSPVRRGQLRDILRREPASCPACHFREI